MKRKGIMAVIILALTFGIFANGMEMKQAMAASQTKKALIVVDPGFSKFSLRVAQHIAAELGRMGYTGTLVTTAKYQTQDATKSDLLVLGGPTYCGQPSGGLKKAVLALGRTKMRTLLFITGGSNPGLEPLRKLALEQGLQVIGSCGIMNAPRQTVNIKEKIAPLLVGVE